MSDVSSFVGRQVDVLALRTSPDLDTQSLFDATSSGEIVTGPEKLSQRWGIAFLTVRGSMPFLPNLGTTFMRAARVGRLRTEAAVMTEFQFAAEQIRQQFSVELTDTTPDDEKLASATLDAILLTANAQLALRVTILSVAGTSRSVILPISVSTLAAPNYAA